MNNESKNRLADLVQDATAAELQRLTCPGCGGGIDVQFVPKSRKGKGVGSLYIMCPNCMWRVISDGLVDQPPWVRDLGLKIQTAAKKTSPQTIK
jgi:hypothetical protein